jgi:hypothetical protein
MRGGISRSMLKEPLIEPEWLVRFSGSNDTDRAGGFVPATYLCVSVTTEGET